MKFIAIRFDFETSKVHHSILFEKLLIVLKIDNLFRRRGISSETAS